MGVFKWLRRERVTVTTRHDADPAPTTTPEIQVTETETTKIGTIRTAEYKRDLAEFQARRSAGNKELQVTPVKKKCGRHSLPISCTDCAGNDNTFNYEKKSANKYKKRSHKRVRSANADDRADALPNIQFLFQNQVFMPGNIFESASYSEPQKIKRRHRVYRSPEVDFFQKHLDFKEEDEEVEPPEFFRNNSLPYDVKAFLSPKIEDVIDGSRAAGDLKVSSHSSSDGKDGCEDKLWEVMSELKNFDQWADEQLQTRTPSKTVSDDSKSDTSAYGLPIASSSNLDVSSDQDKVWSLGKWGVVPVQIKRLPGVSIDHVRKKQNVEINILSDTSAYGLPIASFNNLDVSADQDRVWSLGKWSVVPVQIKRLPGVTIDHVRKKQNVEINILRKCRHPNIILLMGLYPDINDNVQLICERCVDSLYGILHVQGRVLSAQTSVQYALDIANALVFLRMQGYVHTGLNSVSIMVTSHGSAKLADLGPCAKLAKPKEKPDKNVDLYSPEPHYVNIEDTRESNAADCEPLLSSRSSEAYLSSNAVSKPYSVYRSAEHYRWQAPELFVPEPDGSVLACDKSDVYSLCLVLWESCNASIPWNTLSYEKLKELYTLWKTGIRLPQDGTYPGSLLSLLQNGLKLQRDERMDLATLQATLQTVKANLEEIEYIIIPARLSKKKSTFSSVGFDNTSPSESDRLSPLHVQLRADIHRDRDSSSSDSPRDASPLYHSIRKTDIYSVPEKHFISDEEQERAILKYQMLPEKDYSSACSTPIAKIRARITNIGTPGALHRSDSTEYCSILSPNLTNHLATDDHSKNHTDERPTAKLSRSFTPQSYKPLHIKVPEINLDCVKTLLKDQNESGRSSYNFDIKNYSLPTTPIARSNKLRKNAWLSGDLSATERSTEKLKDCEKSNKEEFNNNQSSTDASFSSNKNSSTNNQNHSLNSEFVQNQDLRLNGKCHSSECVGTPQNANNCSKEHEDEVFDSAKYPECVDKENPKNYSPESEDTRQDNFADFKRLSSQWSPESGRERSSSWSFQQDRPGKPRVDDEALVGLSVKPLVAIHEKWIYEANRKTGRSMSLPEDNRSHPAAVKPASHRVDTLQQSLPQLAKRSPKPVRLKNGGQWDQFCQNREAIARSMNFSARDPERVRQKRLDKCMSSDEVSKSKTDQATDTSSIEEFIRELIRKEFQHLIHEMSEDARGDEVLARGVANIAENLRDNADPRRETVTSFSRVKINGNNKPLLQITFSRCGENSLQVLDRSVNVTISEGSPQRERDRQPPLERDRHTVLERDRQTLEDTLVGDDAPALKRCQAFNAIQEAKSTEDLYIDDELSTQLQENFGGRVKLIPLHGSLHEILCEREDDCCLIKVKQENGCDTIYFRCDNSDTESRDAVDAADSVVVSRSVSLVQERVTRLRPRATAPRTHRESTARPKSEIFTPCFTTETRIRSSSSPSLANRDDNEIEVNIENAVCYQDSSSEECIKCQLENDDFELLEKKIEDDLANSTLSSLTCGCLEKISEENLSVINEDTAEK